jgi:hypothetical protein
MTARPGWAHQMESPRSATDQPAELEMRSPAGDPAGFCFQAIVKSFGSGLIVAFQ